MLEASMAMQRMSGDSRRRIEAMKSVRERWGGNGLHWSLDVSFGEDGSMVRMGHSAENMSTLRRLALNLVKMEKSLKIGVAAKRKRAGWDLEYLKAMLQLQE